MIQTATALEVVPVDSKDDLEAFMKLPWRIYENDPHWVPPLLAELEKVLDKRKHPFHQHADSAYFIARRHGAVVGRISATVNHLANEFHNEKVGNFGFFECIDDDEIARALLDTARDWNAARGMTSLLGPLNFSTNDEFSSPGVLIGGFDTPPVLMMSHNPPYYARLLERYGLVKSRDLLSYWCDMTQVNERLVKGVQRIGRGQNVTLRTLDMKDLDGEIGRIKEVYNSAWERNWGFVPMTDAEFEHMAESMKPIVNPRLCVIAEIAGEPVGFALQLPDYNVAFRHMNGKLLPFGWAKFLWYKRKIRHTRVITMGVKPQHRKQGIDSMLIVQLHIESARFDMPRGECSWILEDNMPMRRGLERIGGVVYKTYRVYEKPIRSD
ncbi:MAG: GNAT family N-acetyltransferase [Gemmatimonadota bacterium]